MGSGASGSLKQQLAAQLDGLAKAFQSGQGLGEFFRTINRAKDLSSGGGAGLPTFSLPTRTRYEDISRSAVAAGISAPNINGGLLQNVRQALVQVGSGSSLQYGGMNAYMSSRAVGLGDALMGGASPAVRVQSKSLSEHLKEEVRSDSIEESVAIIRHTSDEILDALGGRDRRVAGKVSKGKRQAPVVIPSKKSGFSWGSLLKTLGTVGAISGVAFGALSMPSVQQWINKMMDPAEREKWLDEVQTWFGKKWDSMVEVWETTKGIAEKVWDAMGSIVKYIDGVTPKEIGRVGQQAFESVVPQLTAQQKDAVSARLVQAATATPIEVEGVSGDSWGRLKELAAGGMGLVGVAKFAKRYMSVSSLKRLYAGGKLVVSGGVSAAGAATTLLGGAAVVAVLGGVVGAIKNEVDRRKVNSVSAQAALEAGQAGFYGFVAGAGNTITWIPFFQLSDGNGGIMGISLAPDEQFGLMALQMGAEVDLVQSYNNRALLSSSVESIKEKLGEMSYVQSRGGVVDTTLANHYLGLIREGEVALKGGDPVAIHSLLSRLKTDNLMVDLKDMRYSVANAGDIPNYIGYNAINGKPQQGSEYLFVNGIPSASSFIDEGAIIREGKVRSGRDILAASHGMPWDDWNSYKAAYKELGIVQGVVPLAFMKLLGWTAQGTDGLLNLFGEPSNVYGNFNRGFAPSILPALPRDLKVSDPVSLTSQYHVWRAQQPEASTPSPLFVDLSEEAKKALREEMKRAVKELESGGGGTTVVSSNNSTSVEVRSFTNRPGEM